MVVALNISAIGPDGMIAGTSPLAELLACLHVLAEPDHHPESRAWTERISGRIDEPLRSNLYRFAPLWARYRLRLMYPLSRDLGRSLEQELQTLAGVADDVFVPLCANAILGRVFPASGAAEVLTSRSWVRDCERRSFNRGDLAYMLTADPDRFRRDLLTTLAECAEAFFDAEWAQTRAVMEASVSSLDRRIETDDAVDVVASLSGMASVRGPLGTVMFDKLQSASGTVDDRGLLMVPSVRAWPHLMVKMDPGLPVVIHYLVQEQGRGLGAQSQDDLRRRLMVLSEPGRWELCRHLIGESITTTELSVRTGTDKTSVSRHLKVMRQAGLISSQRDGRQVFHRLHPSVIVHLGHDVLRALLR